MTETRAKFRDKSSNLQSGTASLYEEEVRGFHHEGRL